MEDVLEEGWTINDLYRLEKAMAEGAIRVKYRDKEIEYRSLREMAQVRDLIKKKLGGTAGATNRRYANFSKGLDCE